jgi:hypothetical protein
MAQLSTDRDFRARLRSLMTNLSGKASKSRRAQSQGTVEQAQQQLAALLRAGDPMSTESVLNLIDLPYGEMNGQARQSWSLSAAT